MSNEKQETIADIVIDILSEPIAENGAKPWLHYLADRILTAHKREMADEKRISDAVIQSLRDKKLEIAGEIAAKEAEVSALRALVGEMADELSKFHAWEEARAIVAKAAGESETISQPHRGARSKAETTEAKDPTHSAVRKG